jgi:hypothetical protein
MTHKSFAKTIDEMLAMIEPALDGLRQGGSTADLRELQSLLRQLLIDLMALIERDPGIEAATADLYAAASALVADSAVGSQPVTKKLRLFRDARVRFRERLMVARPSEHGSRVVWRHQELLLSA